MILKQPTSIEECIYFTNRSINEGKVKAWVFRITCPQCQKALLSKPKEKGKIKLRSDEYICPECGYSIKIQDIEDKLIVNIQYTCPYCKHQGETQIPFKRKKIQIFDEEEQKKKTIDSLRFQCENCKKNIDITKKMK